MMLELLHWMLCQKYYIPSLQNHPLIVGKWITDCVNMFRRVHTFKVLWPTSYHVLFDLIRFHIPQYELNGLKFIWIFQNFPVNYPLGYCWPYPWNDGLPTNMWVRKEGILYDPGNNFRIYGKTEVVNTFYINYTPDFEKRNQSRFGLLL